MAKYGATSPCTMPESKRWTRRRVAEEVSEEAQGRDGHGGLREAALRAAGRSRHHMRQQVAAAVATGEVQVETRAPSSERQVWHHGAAALLDRSHPFSTPAQSGYTARRWVLGGAAGALDALPGGGASGAGRGGAARGGGGAGRASGASREGAAVAKYGATSPCTMPESKRWTRRRVAEEVSEEAQGRDEQGGLREATLRAAGRSRHQMRQQVAAAVAAGEVQVETRAPSSERQAWHHGAAALIDRSHPFFNTSKARIYGASPVSF